MTQSGDSGLASGSRCRHPSTASRRRTGGPAARVGLLVAAGAMLLAGCAGGTDPDAAGTPTSPPLSPTPSAAVLPGAVGAELQQALEGWLAAERLPGVTAAVVTPGGWWAGAAGVDGAGQPLVPEAAMGVGSITKTFTAAEVLVLADRGRVDLDAPVTDYVDLPFDTAGATVRQVLNMSSGFPTDPVEAIVDAVTADLDRDFAVGDALGFVDPDAGRMGALGYGQEYNNVNYDVLGELIEQVTDGSYAQAVRADLLDRTDLQRVWVQDDETPTAPIAAGQAPPDVPIVDPAGPWLPSRALASIAGSAGGMAADAATLARWGYLLYGGHVIGPDLVQQMTTTVQEDDDWYGLGTMLGTLADEPWVGHTGDIGAYHGKLVVFPDTDTAVAYLVPAPATYRFGPVLTDYDLTVQLRNATDTTG